MHRPYKIVKRIADLLFACVLLILCAPLLLLSAAAIKIESKGPVYFKQHRPGRCGAVFTILKFRTMRLETEQNGRNIPPMERITSVGRILRALSIDELPQLFNIIRGDMSFIGPRPLLVKYLPLYSKEQKRRHEVLPGISGWAQVNGRNAITWQDKFELDVFYVDHMSLSLDLKIVGMTITSILRRKGINSSTGTTMPEFKGDGVKIQI